MFNFVSGDLRTLVFKVRYGSISYFVIFSGSSSFIYTFGFMEKWLSNRKVMWWEALCYTLDPASTGLFFYQSIFKHRLSASILVKCPNDLTLCFWWTAVTSTISDLKKNLIKYLVFLAYFSFLGFCRSSNLSGTGKVGRLCWLPFFSLQWDSAVSNEWERLVAGFFFNSALYFCLSFCVKMLLGCLNSWLFFNLSDMPSLLMSIVSGVLLSWLSFLFCADSLVRTHVPCLDCTQALSASGRWQRADYSAYLGWVSIHVDDVKQLW